MRALCFMALDGEFALMLESADLASLLFTVARIVRVDS